MSETSRQVYAEIKAEGLISRLQQEVLRCLSLSSGPMTMREIADFLQINQANTLNPRAAELERLGVIERSGKRHCRITGRTAFVYKMTNSRPAIFASKSRPKLDSIIADATIERLEAEINMLRVQVSQLKGLGYLINVPIRSVGGNTAPRRQWWEAMSDLVYGK